MPRHGQRPDCASSQLVQLLINSHPPSPKIIDNHHALTPIALVSRPEPCFVSVGSRCIRSGRHVDDEVEEGLDGSGMRATRLGRRGRRLTGLQGFYDPVSDRLTEPSLTGISYSFTADGHYEEAYYRAISNRTIIVRVKMLSWLTMRQQRALIVHRASCNGNTALLSRASTGL